MTRWIVLFLFASFAACSVAGSEQLPRIGSTITINQIRYFGIAKNIEDLDSIRVIDQGALHLVHYRYGTSVDTFHMSASERSTFALYLANYEVYMHQRPDPFIADTAIRALLRYLRPWKSYHLTPTPVSVELRDGSQVGGLILARGETQLAISHSVNADTASSHISQRAYQLISIMDVTRIRRADDTTDVVDVHGSAPFLHQAMTDLNVVTVYGATWPPELETDLQRTETIDGSLSGEGAEWLHAPKTAPKPPVTISVTGGLQFVLTQPSVYTEYQHSATDVRTTTMPEPGQELYYGFNATVAFPLSSMVDLGGDVAVIFQPSTADEKTAVGGFDAYQLRMIAMLHLINPQYGAYRKVDLYLLGGLGVSFTEHRLVGEIEFANETQEVMVTENNVQPNFRLGFGLSIALSSHFDVMIESSGQYSIGGSYSSEVEPFRPNASTKVGTFTLHSSDLSTASLGLQAGVRYRL
jgi:hypothetical protein